MILWGYKKGREHGDLRIKVVLMSKENITTTVIGGDCILIQYLNSDLVFILPEWQ
jgi:hypothetical protein